MLAELFRDFHGLEDPAFTVAAALALGMVAQALARHLRVPGIVLLLATGVVFGPDLLDVVRPDNLGSGLQLLVGFAVAIILFEGGLNLNVRRLRKEATVIRRLVTVGALVTALGAAAAAHLILGWGWTTALLFGTLVIVTGPTVINPLLRRIRVDSRLATVLEAEGVFGDAVGALVAVVALEVVIGFGSAGGEAVTYGAWDLISRVVVGGVVGLIGGLLLALLLKFERVLPEGVENVFTLTIAVFLFQMSDALRHESGIVAVIVAGMVVANVRSHALEGLREFKEQLTVMLIGLLFVLLAADVRLEKVLDLGRPGLLTVAVLIFVVRPLNIAVCTWGSRFHLRERLFLMWLAPRGIVAAAVASLFAISLERADIPHGKDLRALVFLVIAVTVALQGLSAGLVARLLGVRPPGPNGFVILGATALGRALAHACEAGGRDNVLIDSNPENCKAAEDEGLRVLYGSGLDENLLRRARIGDREGAVALTANEAVNLAFGRTVHSEAKLAEVRIALRKGHRSVTGEMVRREGFKVCFGEPRNLDFWKLKLDRSEADIEVWTYVGEDRSEAGELVVRKEDLRLFLPLTLVRGERVLLLDEETRLRTGDLLHVAMLSEAHREASDQLRGLDFEAGTESDADD